jgi:hypothetical protein
VAGVLLAAAVVPGAGVFVGATVSPGAGVFVGGAGVFVGCCGTGVLVGAARQGAGDPGLSTRNDWKPKSTTLEVFGSPWQYVYGLAAVVPYHVMGTPETFSIT